MSEDRADGARNTIKPSQAPRSRRERIRRNLLRMLAIVLGLALAAGAVLVYAFTIEPRRLAVRRDTLVFENLPAAWDGRKVAFFSDVHAGPAFTPSMLQRAVAAMAREEPDLVLFGGDLVDSRTPKDAAFSRQIGDALAGIEAPLGKFAIVGNHDNRLRAELNLARGMLEAGGFTLLVNRSQPVDGLMVGGLDESYFGRPDLDRTYAGQPENQFRITLMHQPDYLPAQPAAATDLILSGHSHRGQVAFFGIPVVRVHQGARYPYGLYRLDSRRQLLVSGGLGTVAIHARLFAVPEVRILTLKRGPVS